MRKKRVIYSGLEFVSKSYVAFLYRNVEPIGYHVVNKLEGGYVSVIIMKSISITRLRFVKGISIMGIPSVTLLSPYYSTRLARRLSYRTFQIDSAAVCVIWDVGEYRARVCTCADTHSFELQKMKCLSHPRACLS